MNGGDQILTVSPITVPYLSYMYGSLLVADSIEEIDSLLVPSNSNNFNSTYPYTPKPQVSGTSRVPVLEYHRIEPIPNASSSTRALYVSPEMFELQIAYLAASGYTSLSPQELFDQLSIGGNPSQKSVMITFDDGSRGQYDNAYPILKKYGMRGVFFVNSGSKYITSDELKAMSDNGMSIESHTIGHVNLSTNTDSGLLWYQTVGDKQRLEAITGSEVTSIAYPFCVANGTTMSIISSNGFDLGFTCGKGIDHTYRRRYFLERVFIFNDLENFKKRITGNWEVPIGYSVEY
jgi:peptidoglycan/xylan/chitin deacetylase (PgdA/CDA1 family)